MTQGLVVAAPHAHDDSSVRSVMLLVVTASLPATAHGVVLFGWPAVNLISVTVVSAVAFEALALWVRGAAVASRVGDGSALLAGWLLALSLPPWAPWWLGVLGGAIAMLLGKHAFGGIGQNVFNPAMVARVALLLAFPLEMTSFVRPFADLRARSNFEAGLAVTFGGAGAPDSLTGATLLGLTQTLTAKGEALAAVYQQYGFDELVFGGRSGSLGECSPLLVVLGGLVLLWKRVISWHTPLGVLLGALVPAMILHWMAPSRFLAVGEVAAGGGLLLAAFFIATDPASSPTTPPARLSYGFGIGAITLVIRDFCALAEGVAFAVLLLNALGPTLDRKLKPRVYGRNRDGTPRGVIARTGRG